MKIKSEFICTLFFFKWCQTKNDWLQKKFKLCCSTVRRSRVQFWVRAFVGGWRWHILPVPAAVFRLSPRPEDMWVRLNAVSKVSLGVKVWVSGCLECQGASEDLAACPGCTPPLYTDCLKRLHCHCNPECNISSGRKWDIATPILKWEKIWGLTYEMLHRIHTKVKNALGLGLYIYTYIHIHMQSPLCGSQRVQYPAPYMPTFDCKWSMQVDKRKSSKRKHAAAGVSVRATERTILELKEWSKQEEEAIRACLLLVRTKAHWSSHCWRPDT